MKKRGINSLVRKKNILGGSKIGQVWVETVIYTLIAFVLIGAVLGFVKPKIQEMQDKATIQKSIEVMQGIESQFSSLYQGGPGNQRTLGLQVSKGVLEFDGVTDKVLFVMEDSKYAASDYELEAGSYFGNINIKTEKVGKSYTVTLESDYSEKYNLQYNDADEKKTLTKSSTPYNLLIANKGNAPIGDEDVSKTKINIQIIN